MFQVRPEAVGGLLDGASGLKHSLPLALPQPDGSTRLFRVWSTPIGDAVFCQRHPELQTYTGIALDDPRTTVKLDRTPAGLHGLILDGRSKIFIDPYNSATDSTYLVYDGRSVPTAAGSGITCAVLDDSWPATTMGGAVALKQNGLLHRTYRLALACTGEYAVTVTGNSVPTKADVLAKMVTSINRVNGVYEREVAVSLQLVGNNEDIIFLDPATDPYTNNSNASTLLGENQAVVDQYIGTANYDIGHVFSTGSGGLASLSSVCKAFGKARGTTGRANPMGDPFDIDFVAHEFGHQFGADHTFNAATGSCAGNGEPTSAYEPGSGSTIMAYAGICGSGDNLQPNSDPYFHTRSLDQITTYIASAAVATCPVSEATINLPPALPSYTAAYSIPWLTPFELTAPEATDATRDAPLTYCWEEWDRGQFGSSFAATSAAGPIFRSFLPDTSRTRVFPTPRRLVRNSYNYIGEKLPDAARPLKFMLTVRDVMNGLGSFNWGSSDTLRLQVVPASDTFQVLSFRDSTALLSYDQLEQTVRWNVSNTASAPISCALVDIYYSTDSGYTWPYLLKANADNNGTATVTLPQVPTTAGRIKIKSVGNVFFAINERPFTVFPPVPDTPVYADLSLYPVPAVGAVTVQVPDRWGSLDGFVVNTLGQRLWEGTLPPGMQALDVSSWRPGAYTLVAFRRDTGERVVRRFLTR